MRSQGGRKDTSTATATIELQLLVDGVAAQPGVVIYCSRRSRSAPPWGASCRAARTCQLTDEEILLLLSTMDAASFNFGADVHTITVQAKRL